MIAKIAPLMVLGMAAQSYYNKTKKGKEEMKHAKKKKMKYSNMTDQDAQRAGIEPSEFNRLRFKERMAGEKGNLSKGDLNKDGKMSGYEKKRSKAIQKAILKQRSKKSSANTGNGTGAAQGKYGK